jgi:3-deoxy-D-arabino-heptulosonate 7-phosphate (DAHP) synthase
VADVCVNHVQEPALERNQSERRTQQEEKMTHPKRKMTHQKRAQLRKSEHLISMLHDGCRHVSLEASPCSPEPQEKTQRKAQRSVKSGEEEVDKQEYQGKTGRMEDQPKIQEKHRW